MNETAREQYYRKKLTRRADRNFIATVLMIIAFTVSIIAPLLIGILAGERVAGLVYDPIYNVRQEYKEKVETFYNEHHENTLENTK